MKDGVLMLALLAVLAAGVGGCRVDKSNNGDNVKIATPFGAIAVNKDQPTAAEIGLPAYPGSVLTPVTTATGQPKWTSGSATGSCG